MVPSWLAGVERDVVRSALRLALSSALLCSLAAPLAAQLGPIGLTVEGAQWFENQDPAANDAGDLFGSALAAGDFDGDGVDDLATGLPMRANALGLHAGGVVVRYGLPAGGGLGPATFRAEAEGTYGHQRYGSALAAGDFDGDGFDDLAIGIPYRQAPQPRQPGGAVRVFYGSLEGLHADRYDELDESASPEAPPHYCFGTVLDPKYSNFGVALEAADFDSDGFDDLAIGASTGCEQVGSYIVDGGAVFVAHGKPGGLLPFYGYRISQNSYGVYDDVEPDDLFGAALAAADFDADGYADLAIGTPGENEGSGAITVIMGSQNGLIFADSVFWLPGALGETPYTGDGLGAALAAGDYDGDGFADLAIGAPGKNLPGADDAGIVDVAYGGDGPGWFDLARTDRLTQGSIYGVAAQDGTADYFGQALAAGDFDGDGPTTSPSGNPAMTGQARTSAR